MDCEADTASWRLADLLIVQFPRQQHCRLFGSPKKENNVGQKKETKMQGAGKRLTVYSVVVCPCVCLCVFEQYALSTDLCVSVYAH